jgi:inhibitor of cysteine peptidase
VCDYGGNLSSTTITKADAGKTVTVSPGGTVAISLDENPTTGFRWELEPRDDAALELLSSEYIAPAPGAGVGGGGRRLWTFKAKKSGEVRLVLKRRRVWQKDDSDGERFEVTIGVTT